ncbi:MAG: arginine deiminase-related protein [Balneolaceae bacterium]
MAKIISSVDQIDFTVEELPVMPLPQKVLMVEPTYFDVEYVINPHMENQIGNVDNLKARREWQKLFDGFENIGYEVAVIEGKPGLPDMVFCSNHALPHIDEDGQLRVLMSTMRTTQRKDEVAHLEPWLRQHGYEVLHLDPATGISFEGMGDAIWHTGRKLLWGGYGIRTDFKAHEQISKMFDVPVIALELIDETFYHLDTCFCALDEESVLIYPGAFTKQGLELIHSLYTHVLEAPEVEAKRKLAVNATCPNGNDVLIQRGASLTNKKLQENGFSVYEFSTDEFVKSGGSVFCMKLMLW